MGDAGQRSAMHCSFSSSRCRSLNSLSLSRAVYFHYIHFFFHIYSDMAYYGNFTSDTVPCRKGLKIPPEGTAALPTTTPAPPPTGKPGEPGPPGAKGDIVSSTLQWYLRTFAPFVCEHSLLSTVHKFSKMEVEQSLTF